MALTSTGTLVALLLLVTIPLSLAVPSPKSKWQVEATRVLPDSPVPGEPSGAWWAESGTASGGVERIGRRCDEGPVDLGAGCVAVFVADRGDPFTTVNLPVAEQDDFLNTLYYNKAWFTSEDGLGLRGGSLPIAGADRDWDPVCYVAELELDGVATTVLGYEEPNGNQMVPCGGSREGFPFTPSQIENATEEELQVMCEYCYRSVCSGSESQDPRQCGARRDGAVDIGGGNNEAHLTSQVSTAYHCHLTMADEGACDFVHYNQHVSSRDYLMESGVLCGWERVSELQITHCDCSREAGRANGCFRQQCLDMAVAGVVCGNCGGCSEARAYEGIFDFTGARDKYEGSCGHAHNMLKEHGPDSVEYLEARQLCAKGLFCRENDDLSRGSCGFYCGQFDDPERCGAQENGRRLLSEKDDDGKPDESHSNFVNAIRANSNPRRTGLF
mmetsp:Transcript_3280/g.5446  ORF Transcript_3280/g.5446 Transcript_3280/m.5446 type:complete len:443 (+) Transcript_3280:119-1447(+)